MSPQGDLLLISVLCPDRRGVVADVADVVYAMGGNLEATSQTIMQGWFTMLVAARFPTGASTDQVEQRLRDAGSFDVIVRRGGGCGRGPAEGEPFIITCVGDDKPGIVRRLARCCANRNVNIDDVWNEVREGRFITIFHVTLPRDLDAKDFRYELETAAGELGITLTLQHQDIFTATNSLEVHTGRRKPRGTFDASD